MICTDTEAVRSRPVRDAARTRYPVCLHQLPSVIERHARPPGVTGDNLLMLYRLTGRLDMEALRRALNYLAGRHEPLRTIFPAGDGDPEAVILDPEIPLVVCQRALDTAALQQERTAPADIRRDRPTRASLYVTGPDRANLVITIDHLACDGINSLAIIGRELGAAYSAFADGGVPRLDPLPYAFSDYAQAHQRWLSEDNRGHQLRYWDSVLPPGCGIAAVPLKAGDAVSAAATCTVQLPAGTVEALQRSFRTSPFVLGLTGVFLALRAAGQSPPAVMTTATNPWPGLDRLVGHFASLVILSPPECGLAAFADLLPATQATVRGATAHADLPFTDVMQEVRPGFDWATVPPYVFYGARSARPYPSWAASGLRAEAVIPPAPAQMVHPGLKWQLLAGGGTSSFVCQFPSRAYSHDAVGQLVRDAAAAMTAAAGTGRPHEPVLATAGSS
jgi:hypothetical protein